MHVLDEGVVARRVDKWIRAARFQLGVIDQLDAVIYVWASHDDPLSRLAPSWIFIVQVVQPRV